jgi:hypothetical protein
LRTGIGQYNVRTLYQKGRLAQLNKIMGEYKLAMEPSRKQEEKKT